MQNNTIRIPARALLSLLAERVDHKKFLQDHHLAPTETHPDNHNFFDLKLREGRLIRDIEIEKSENEDDDWILIEFGEPDPAIYRFLSPVEESD